jgi:hypothetical protein
MSKKTIAWLMPVVLLVLLAGICLAENITFRPTKSLHHTGGWYVQKYYAQVDTGWCDSTGDSSRVIDTLETNWVYVGNYWEVLWVIFDWTKEDTSLGAEGHDSLHSVVIQGCLHKTDYPAVLAEYSTITSGKTDTLTVATYHPIDSLVVDPPYPYVRAVMIYSQWMLQAQCQGEGRDTTYVRSDRNEYEIHWRAISVYQ